VKRVPLSPLLVFCNADSYIFFPATPWMNAPDAEMIREALEARNMPGSGTMTLTVGLQTCNTVDAPDAAVALATSRTADGLSFPGSFSDKSGNTGNRQLVRFGYLVKNTTTSDSTVRYAWACGAVELHRK